MIVNFTQRWHEIEPLIDQLFEVPAAEQAQWLRSHCDDESLRALVAQALTHAPEVEALERGMVQWLPTLADTLHDKLPIIAGYRVLRFVGAGGMASVFEAERELPGGPQKVALKLLRMDVHDSDERRRFLREQRILARLQHPHIAQLLDAGFSPTGTPFLALEFVAGNNLVQHCEQSSIDVHGRLALFIDVCAAVEHAHRSLIVHRDLKPSNVLVGADGCVKLVDFGIAKLLTSEGEAEHTRAEARRLTRSYAAPEQFIGDTATTAIDVYALGVLLAELLCHQQPRRMEVRDDMHVPAFDDEALRRKLGVDLHAIVHQAMRLDPIRRYGSVAALRDDIERYLDGKPLQARADTLAYRVFTLAKRHMWAVSASAVIAVVLAGATAVGLYESHRARIAAAEARMQASAAEGEAQRADALKSFLEGLFDNTPHGAQTSGVTEVLLERGRERADRDFANQPALRVEILALIGDLERRSGHTDRAQQPLEEAASLATIQFGVTDRRTLHIEYLLAEEADALGRVRSGRLRLQHAIEAFESVPHYGSPEEVQALAWLAGLDERMGESKEAIDVGNRAVTLARRALADNSDALSEAVTNLGWIYMDAGHPDRAEPLLREALARKRSRYGANHPDVADAMTLLSTALLQRGRYDESEKLMRNALDIDMNAYASPDAHIAGDLNNLANVLQLEDRFDEASGFYAKSLATDSALTSTPSLDETVTLSHLAHIRFSQGAYADAEASFREVIERKQRLLGADYDDNGRGDDASGLAEVLIARGRIDEAQMIADKSLVEARRRHREAHPDIASALAVQAEVAAARGAHKRAETLAEEAFAIYATLSDQDSEKAIRVRLLFGETLQAIGRSDEAKRQFENALAAAKAITPNKAALVAHVEADLACTEVSLNDSAAADQLRIEAKGLLAEINDEPNGERDLTMRLLGCERDRGQPKAEARHWEKDLLINS